MQIDTQGLAQLVSEASVLSNKLHLNKQEQRRFAFLQTAIASVRSGMSLAEIEERDLADRYVRVGLNPKVTLRSQMDAEQRAHAKVWQRFFNTGTIEDRDMTVGNGTPAYLKGNVGSFVPLGFFQEVFAAKKNTDALFNPDIVTYLETTHGKPIQFGLMGDTETVAVLTSEAGSATEADITSTSGIMLGAYTFRSPMFHASIESFQDVEIAGGVVELFKKFVGERIARGVGPYLVTGSGSSQPTGLVTALEALGGASVTATGSSANTGGSETGATSVGSADIANLFYALDEAYRDSDKTCWLMTSGTLGKLATIVTKMGLPLVNWQGPEAFILGKPVRISPSMQAIGSGNVPIVFGDLTYFVVRCAIDEQTRVQLYKEAPGVIENGKFGLRAYVRYDSSLMFNDTGSPSPLVYLQNHS